MLEARLYRSGKNSIVHCLLCSHYCAIKEGRRGRCKVRENREGILYSLVYGHLVAENVDPVEKKPLFHFLPGSLSYSIATVGCNFICHHCQNASISQANDITAESIPGVLKSPHDIVYAASTANCASISYTYVEPTIFFEFAYDCMVVAREKGLKNIFVSNGYMSIETTELLTPLLDAINIDLKSFSDSFYKSICGARLQPVLDSVKRMHGAGVLVEVTTLVIPGHNDSDDELQQIAEFLLSVDPAIPWHVTGFYPTCKMMNSPPTSIATLERARQIGLSAGLHTVYSGNRPGSRGENTACPSCGIEVILRHGFSIKENKLLKGCCPSCRMSVYGIWE